MKVGQPGLPDVFAIKDGVLAAVEVKRKGNKPTQLQQMMLKDLEDHGAWTLVAYSVSDVEKKFKIVPSPKQNWFDKQQFLKDCGVKSNE